MRISISKTDYYSIEIDAGKNRAYLTFIGFCKNEDEMPTFLDDVSKAARQLRNGFTLLTNAVDFKTPSPEVSALHEKSQKIWIEKGLSKTAEILPETATTQIALNRYSKATGMKKKAFSQEKEAEAWLDSEDE
jgi:hypothetical protein